MSIVFANKAMSFHVIVTSQANTCHPNLSLRETCQDERRKPYY